MSGKYSVGENSGGNVVGNTHRENICGECPDLLAGLEVCMCNGYDLWYCG